MSKQSRYIVAVAAMLCISRVDAQIEALPALQGDIEITYTLPNGEQLTRSGRLYRSGTGKVRQDAGYGAMITDLQAGSVTLLVDERNEAHVITIPPELRELPPLGAERRIPESVQPFEETTIDGQRIAKTRIVGQQGEAQEVWTATDLGIVTFARFERNGATITQELRNLDVGEPDPSVFEIPTDYTVVEMPSRFDSLDIRTPAVSELPFGEGTRIVLPTPQIDR